MSLGQMPLAAEGGFVFVGAQVDAQVAVGVAREGFEDLGEVVVDWGGVGGVATEDKERIDSAGAHPVEQVAKGSVGATGGRWGVGDSRSDVAERLVDRMHRGVNRRDMSGAREDEALAFVG